MAHRYRTFDAMRGIAAIAVVLLHTGHMMHIPMFKHAYLAVDFFFMLSGFVLAVAYESKLHSSLSFVRFLELRVVRLYPLFLLGVILGALNVIGQIVFHSPNAMPTGQAVIGFFLNSLMIPYTDIRGNFFPFDPVAWSLFFELVINVAFAAILFQMKTRWLAILTATIGTLYLYFIVRTGHGSVGSEWPTAWLGLLRVSLTFPMGVLLARACVELPRRHSWLAVAVLIVFGATMILRFPSQPDWVFDAIAVFIVFPLLLWAAAVFELPEKFDDLSKVLGDTSYPLYLVHYPILQIVAFAFVRKLHVPATVVIVIYLVGIFGLSWLLAIKYDPPARAWLKRKLTRSRQEIGTLI